LVNGDQLALRTKGCDTIALRIADMVGKDSSAPGLLTGAVEHARHVLTIKQVVAQDQRGRRLTNEILSDDERLCQSVRAGLLGVVKLQTPMMAVAQQCLKQ